MLRRVAAGKRTSGRCSAQIAVKTDFSRIVPHYKRRSVLPTTYTPSEIKKVENAIDTATDTGKRDRAIILLATRMGLRSGDIAKLKWSEVDLNSGYIHLRQEKTGIPLSLQMPEAVMAAITTFLESAKPSERCDEYVFHGMSAPYGRITFSSIYLTIFLIKIILLILLYKVTL